MNSAFNPEIHNICSFKSALAEDSLCISFYLVPNIPVTAHACERESIVNMPSISQHTSHEQDIGNGCLPIAAAIGTRKSSKGHWKYASTASFVHCPDQAWSDLGLKDFKATNKAGVEEWLRWIVEHTPRRMEKLGQEVRKG
jgi:hypothetical protein